MRPNSVVKLSKNWRNHPAILRYPNERFYDNELEACAPARTTDSLLTWSELGRAGFPIIFENIAGAHFLSQALNKCNLTSAHL